MLVSGTLADGLEQLTTRMRDETRSDDVAAIAVRRV